jgi:hypothetical protein
MIFLLATDPHGLTLTFVLVDTDQDKNVNHARRVITLIICFVKDFHFVSLII